VIGSDEGHRGSERLHSASTSMRRRCAGQVSEPEVAARRGSGRGLDKLSRKSAEAGERRWAAQPSGDDTIRRSLISYRETDHLRVLIANERKDRLALVAPIVAALGHEVIAREIDSKTSGWSRPGNDPTSRSSGSAKARTMHWG
jgi:hypothetical protein